MIHLQQEFTHNRSKSDLGWFTRFAEAIIELSQRGVFHACDGDRCHIEAAPDFSAATADMTLALPGPALTGPRSQASQRGGFPPAQLTQFRHFTQGGDGRDGTNPIEFRQFLDLRQPMGRAAERRRQFGFRGGDLGGELPTQPSLFPGDEPGCTMLGSIAGGDQLGLEMLPPANQVTQFSEDGLWHWRGLGVQSLTERGERSGIDRIILGTPALGLSKVPDTGGVEDADGTVGGLERGHDSPFVTASGFTDQVDPSDRTQKPDQARVTGGRVGQQVLAVLEVELQGGLGDIQPGVDDLSFFGQCIHGVGAQTCTYERGARTPAPSTVRVTDTVKRQRLRLSRKLAVAVSGLNEHVSAAAFGPAGPKAAPSSRLAGAKQERWKETYKDLGEGGRHSN